MASNDSSAATPTGLSTRPNHGPFSRWPQTADGALAIVVFLIEVTGVLSGMANDSGEFAVSMLGEIPAATWLLLAVSSIALLWRKSLPLVVLFATLIPSLVWDLMDLDGGPSLAILISLYGVGRYIADIPVSLLAVAGAMVIAVANDLLEAEPISVIGLSLALVLVAWYVGRRVRGRREYLALIEERAEFQERERAAEAQRAVDEERTRIARELHDVVAHRVSLITVQAGAAQTVADSDPERSIRAMEAVEEAGREALQELRQILGVLRSDDRQDDLAPIHGLDEIPSLVADMRDAGMDVTLTSNGVPGALPARVDLASYRIVQEALTNVLKHAGPSAEAKVRLSTDDRLLIIEVTDRGSGGSTLPGSGQGLVGMRERAVLVGGTFEAGPRPDGGFRIIARLPTDQGQP